jgi:hypothetical protein
LFFVRCFYFASTYGVDDVVVVVVGVVVVLVVSSAAALAVAIAACSFPDSIDY